MEKCHAFSISPANTWLMLTLHATYKPKEASEQSEQQCPDAYSKCGTDAVVQI